MVSASNAGCADADRPSGAADHPRTLGWVAAAALAMGGSNQSLFLMTALIAGQGEIPGQGSAAVPLLVIGVLLAWAAAPGWTELVLMYPKRVGGIAATCAEAFRPYNPVLANLTLDGLEALLRKNFSRRTGTKHLDKVNLVRYADDFIISGSSRENRS